MDHVLVRYSEIGTKSRRVAGRMRDRLRDRVAERLAHEGHGDAAVDTIPGRVLVGTGAAREVAPALAELPGVASASPARRVPAGFDAIAAATDDLDVDSPFAVRANTAGDQPFTSEELERRLGAHIQALTGADVDLEAPATTVEVDVRQAGAFVFTERYAGPGGYPVGSQDPLVALISGGIDSPVAAYEAMTRGADIVPVYFYNKPLAAGDHVARFESALSKLVRMHPAKTWRYRLVDLEPVNEALMAVDSGRMVLHRRVLFRVAEHVARETDCVGLVTGESLGQKSSQTAANLAVTSAATELPVHRPLISATKDDIVRRARELGTFEDAVVDSACRTIAPDHPATRLGADRLADLEAAVDLDALVETAIERIEVVDL
ncbi:MAG: tRNA sulfurtransferase [Halobacteriales archaeon]